MRRFLTNESGQGLVEYGLIIALVAVIALVGLTAFRDETGVLFSGIEAKLPPGF